MIYKKKKNLRTRRINSIDISYLLHVILLSLQICIPVYKLLNAAGIFDDVRRVS